MIEQNRLKRAGLGLRGWDVARACPGFTLFTPLTNDSTAYLIDLDGSVVHTWTLPYPPGLYGYLATDGTLVYNARTAEESDRFIRRQPWKGGALLGLDWDGNVLWEVQQPDHHHDGIWLRNGNLMLLCLGVLPPELVAQVRGGVPGSEHRELMYSDYLVEMTTSGEVVWEWRVWEHLDPEIDVLDGPVRRSEWTHGNAVAELPDGNVVLSMRHISTVLTVDRPGGEVISKLGPPTIAQQHAPAPLPNGNLLIFDNGTHRRDQSVPFSRVIEVNPATSEIVWSYQDRRQMDFFSPLISNAQRLPNGNTLICEGSFGRLFEVTTEGELVWEYVNPHFGQPPEDPNKPEHNAVFRAYRYSADEIERARGR